MDHYTGTRDMAGQHAFDTAKLAQWLGENLADFQPVRIFDFVFRDERFHGYAITLGNLTERVAGLDGVLLRVGSKRWQRARGVRGGGEDRVAGCAPGNAHAGVGR